jgi:hypothetical protein
MRRPSGADLRAAAWALRALRSARRQLAVDALAPPRLPRPPVAGRPALRGVEAALHRRRATWLERAVVRQVWLAGHGEHRQLVIGVRGADDFAAHAWRATPPSAWAGYVELLRR